MNTISTDAVVLHRIDYGEADRILTVLTPHDGKLSVLAKGVRRPKSKLAGGVELFSIAQIVYIKGRGELKTLVSAQLKTHYGGITASIERTMCAYDCLRFMQRYTEHECEELYYDLLTQSLSALADPQIPHTLTELWFGVRLLEASGHGINTHTDATGRPMIETDQFLFDTEAMAFMPHTSGKLGSSHIKCMRLALMVAPQQLAKIQHGEQLAADLTSIIKSCLKQYAAQ